VPSKLLAELDEADLDLDLEIYAKTVFKEEGEDE
jgi:hypothetical protein